MNFSCSICPIPISDRAAASSKEELGILEVDENYFFLVENLFQNTYNHNLRSKIHLNHEKLTDFLRQNVSKCASK